MCQTPTFRKACARSTGSTPVRATTTQLRSPSSLRRWNPISNGVTPTRASGRGRANGYGRKGEHQEQPTDDQYWYIVASRRAAARRQRTVLGAVAVALGVRDRARGLCPASAPEREL